MNKTIVIVTFVLSACLLAAKPQQTPTVEGIVYLSEFASLQDAVTAVPNGGTVIVPRGIWEGDAVIPAGKYVHIQGVSPAVLGQTPPLGSSQWDYLLANYSDTFLNGSILRGQIDASANASKLALTNLLMIGHGSGTAITIGADGYMSTVAPIEGVSIGNYDVGIRATKAYLLTIDKMQIAGVGTGLIIRDGNLNRLWNVDITYCQLGADLKGEVIWQGGSVQACTDGAKVYLTGGYIGQIHFEQIANISLDFDGYGSKLDPNFYATNSGRVIIRGYNNILDMGWVSNVEFVYPKSSYNFVRLYGNYTAGGWQDRIETIKNIGTVSTQYVNQQTGQVYYPDGVVIRGADGKNYRLIVTDGVLGVVEVK